jgi:hypothetical protein
VAVVCLDHGLRDPSSSKPYQMVPIEEHVKNPAVIELVKAFGRGELQHGAAQAAAWHLNSGVSWQELAAKQQGTERSLVRPPYFSPYEIQAAVAYAGEAARRGQLAQMERDLAAAGTVEGSEAISAAPDDVADGSARKEEKQTDQKSRTRSRTGTSRREAGKAGPAADAAK